MRLAVLLLLAPAAFAQTQPRNEVWAFVSAGPGIAYDRMVGRDISTQIAVSWERRDAVVYLVKPDGSTQLLEAIRVRTHPLDFLFRYHFYTETRWKPYVGAGVHYVGRPPGGESGTAYHNLTKGALGGGTLFLINKSFAVVVDGRAYIGTHESYDASSKAALGVALRW